MATKTEFKLTFRGPELTAQLRQGVERGVFRAANIARNEMVRLIQRGPKSGRTYKRGSITHQASAPGEPPATDTGALVRSLRVDHTPGSLAATVTCGAKYGAELEYGTKKMAARPFFRRAFKTKREEMTEAIASAIKKEMA